MEREREKEEENDRLERKCHFASLPLEREHFRKLILGGKEYGRRNHKTRNKREGQKQRIKMKQDLWSLSGSHD